MIHIEQLSPYLPYGLEFYGGSNIWKMIGLASDGAVVLDNGLHRMIIEPDQVGTEYVPILLPIMGVFINGSDYHKAFEKEVPMAWGALWCDTALHSYQKVNYFFKNKFDVFGLIEKKLAEDASKIYKK